MPKIIHPDFGVCRINEKGYPRISWGEHEGKYLHRAVFERVAGRPPRPGFHIHHQNGKLCWCPHNLIEIQAELHPPSERPRNPWTGEYWTREQYFAVMGCYPGGVPA